LRQEPRSATDHGQRRQQTHEFLTHNDVNQRRDRRSRREFLARPIQSGNLTADYADLDGLGKRALRTQSSPIRVIRVIRG
jgi:hypothetical protein